MKLKSNGNLLKLARMFVTNRMLDLVWVEVNVIGNAEKRPELVTAYRFRLHFEANSHEALKILIVLG